MCSGEWLSLADIHNGSDDVSRHGFIGINPIIRWKVVEIGDNCH